MNMDIELSTAFYGAASTIVLGGIVALGRLAKKWMDLQVQTLESSIENQRRDAIRERLEKEAFTAVQVIERTFVRPAKNDGSWDSDPELRAEAKRRAAQLAYSMLTEGDIKLAKEEFGSVEDYIGIMIEFHG